MTAQTSRKETLAIVEDDVSLLSALAFALEMDGFRVKSYTNGRQLLAAPEPVSCVIVDLKLPDMDGLALIERLRRVGRDEPAILITTNPDERCRRAAADANVPIVEKPLIGGDLRRRIGEAIGEAAR